MVELKWIKMENTEISYFNALYLSDICDQIEENKIFRHCATQDIIPASKLSSKLRQMFGKGFIYLLCDGSNVIYVGKTKNIYNRLFDHKYTKKFTDVILLGFNLYLKDAEFMYIRQFMPTQNIHWVKDWPCR